MNAVRINRFKTIFKLTNLKMTGIAPVTRVTVECSNSSLRFVKSSFRNTMREDCFNALLLLVIHKDISSGL